MLWDRIITHGQEVAYQEWDSGGPGAGAGRDSVYRYGRKYYVSNDAELKVFASLPMALKYAGLDQVNDATTRIWYRGKGSTFKRDDQE